MPETILHIYERRRMGTWCREQAAHATIRIEQLGRPKATERAALAGNATEIFANLQRALTTVAELLESRAK